MLHLGRCCGTPLCGGKPAVRGRGRRDAVATQHRLTPGQSVMLQPADTGEGLLQYDIHGAFWKAVRPPTPTSERGERGACVLCAASAQIDCDQPSANIAPKRAAVRGGRRFKVRALATPKGSLFRARHHANRNATTSLRCHSQHHGTTSRSPCSATMRIFRRDLFHALSPLSPSFHPDRRSNRVLSPFCALSPSLLPQPSSPGRFFFVFFF